VPAENPRFPVSCGPSADQWVFRSRLVADAFGAPVLRDQGTDRPAGHGKVDPLKSGGSSSRVRRFTSLLENCRRSVRASEYLRGRPGRPHNRPGHKLACNRSGAGHCAPSSKAVLPGPSTLVYGRGKAGYEQRYGAPRPVCAVVDRRQYRQLAAVSWRGGLDQLRDRVPHCVVDETTNAPHGHCSRTR
jgi:hypothetical protein